MRSTTCTDWPTGFARYAAENSKVREKQAPRPWCCVAGMDYSFNAQATGRPAAACCCLLCGRHGRNLQSTGWCCLLSCSALETLWLGRNLQSTGSHAADGSLLLLLSSGPRRSGSSLAWTAASHHGSWDRCRRWTWTISQHVPIGRPALPAKQRKIARFGKNRPPVLLC